MGYLLYKSICHPGVRWRPQPERQTHKSWYYKSGLFGSMLDPLGIDIATQSKLHLVSVNVIYIAVIDLSILVFNCGTCMESGSHLVRHSGP